VEHVLKKIESELNTKIFITPSDLFMPLIHKVVKKLALNGNQIHNKYKNLNKKVDLEGFNKIFID